MESLFQSIVPRWFYKRTAHYLRGSMPAIDEATLRNVRCRGDVRAARRRLERDARLAEERGKARSWRKANERSLPFRMKIIEAIVEAQRKLRDEILGKARARRAA